VPTEVSFLRSRCTVTSSALGVTASLRPHAACSSAACSQGLPARVDEAQHDLQFSRRERDRMVGAAQRALLGIDGEVGERCDQRSQCRRPAHQRPYASHEFAHGKRFGHVVVGAALESVHAVMQRVACGQHQARRHLAGCAQGPQKGQTVAIRQAAIDDQHRVAAPAHTISGL